MAARSGLTPSSLSLGAPVEGGGDSANGLPLAGKAVLIIEDEWMIAMSLQDMLVEAGARLVDIVDSVASATRTLTNGEAFDLAVLDLHLKDGDARPLFKLLSDRAIPFIVTTGGDVACKESDRSQTFAVLAKPCRDGEIIDALRPLAGR